MPSLISHRQSVNPSGRQSVARQSVAPASSQFMSTQLELPPYEPPKHALNRDAQVKLQQLQKDRFQALKDEYERATEALVEAAGELNTRLKAREVKVKNKRKRGGTVDGEEEDRDEDEEGDGEELERYRTAVDGKTRSMEVQTRKLIDGRHMLELMEEGIKHTQLNAGEQSSQAATRRTRAKQAATRWRSDDHGDDSDEPDPTLPGTVPPTADTAEDDDITLPSLHETFTTHVSSATTTYKAHPSTHKYAQHNDYISFRRTIHDALAPDSAPLPHSSQWFTTDNKPAANLTSTDLHTLAANAGDADAEIAISRVTTSLKCPLTLLPFEHPVTSTTCKHSFEKSAISAMIKQSTGPPTTVANQVRRRWQRGEDKYVQCPVGACNKEIREADLREDKYLQRQAKLLVKKGEEGLESEGESGDEGEGDGFQSIDEAEEEEE